MILSEILGGSKFFITAGDQFDNQPLAGAIFKCYRKKVICFTSLTREVGIGANSYLLEIGGDKVILDSGLHPKMEGPKALPTLDLVAGRRDIRAIFVSHCHLDHIGSLPVMMRELPDAEVFMTKGTARIGQAMLHNSINVMARQREDLGIIEYPLYTHKETERMAMRWRETPFQKPLNLSGERPAPDETTFEFFEAGHIPGAAGTLFRHRDRTVFYTGDVLFEDQNITRAARFPRGPLDTVIIETTRGDTPSEPGVTRATEIERLGRAINDVHEAGGSVLLPVFALGKTQELLAVIDLLRRRKAIRDCPLYIGGLSTKITGLVDELRNQIPRLQPELNLMQRLEPFSVDGDEIASMPLRGGRIYAISSGMMTKNTLSHTMARRLLPESGHAILFVGYADPDTPGGRIKAAWRRGDDRVDLGDGGDSLPLRCRVEDFNFTGHASREALVGFLKSVRPQNILLVHGDPSAISWFQSHLADELPGSRVVVPQPGIPVEI